MAHWCQRALPRSPPPPTSQEHEPGGLEVSRGPPFCRLGIPWCNSCFVLAESRYQQGIPDVYPP